MINPLIAAVLSTTAFAGQANVATVVRGLDVACGDAVVTCPRWLTDASAEQEQMKQALCVRTQPSDARQQHYTRQIEAAGWRFRVGLANAFYYQREGRCMIVAAFPEADWRAPDGSERTLSDREPIVLLFAPEPKSPPAPS